MTKNKKIKDLDFKEIHSFEQIYFQRETPIENDGILWIIYGELENGILGYEIMLDTEIIHQNPTGIFVDNEYARENIENGESPIREDALQWIENNIGQYEGSDLIEDYNSFLDFLKFKITSELKEKVYNI